MVMAFLVSLIFFEIYLRSPRERKVDGVRYYVCLCI